MSKENEVRVKGVNGNLSQELKNIAANHGTTVSGFMKTKIREIVNSYPPEMRQAPRLD